MYKEGGIVTAINACYTTAFKASVFVCDYGENEKKPFQGWHLLHSALKIMSIYILQSLIGSIFCCICDNIIYILTEKYIHLCLDYTWANKMKEKNLGLVCELLGLSSKIFVTCITRFLYVVLIFQLYWQISFHCIYMYMQPFHWLLLGQTFRNSNLNRFFQCSCPIKL